MATHSSILPWRRPWIEEPGGLQFMVSVAKSWTQLKQLSMLASSAPEKNCARVKFILTMDISYCRPKSIVAQGV